MRLSARAAGALAVSLAGAACGDGATGAADTTLPPIDLDASATPRTFDCDRISQVFLARCADHLGIDDDTSACVAIRDGQVPGPLAASIARAATICAQTADACDRIFVCVADADGLSALALDVHVTGSATVEGEAFTFDAPAAWAWLGTKADATAGDLAVLFTHAGRPWYFKLEDFAERAATHPFVVDASRPVKLENGEDNVEIASGTVTVAAFAAGGAFDVRATATDPLTGEAVDVRVVGRFGAAE